MSRAIHFSHHLCGNPVRVDSDVDARWQDLYGRSNVFNRPSTGCRRLACVENKYRTRPFVFTNSPEEATCKCCLRELADGRVFYGGMYNASGELTDHRKMMIRAWTTCCRFKGAPWPFLPSELVVIEACRAWNRPRAGFLFPSLNDESKRGGDALRESVEGAGFPAAMHQVACELLLAAEWLDHASDAIARAERMFDDMREYIESSEISEIDVMPTQGGTAA